MKSKIIALTGILLLAASLPALAAPRADLWPRWEKHDSGSSDQVDHSSWERILGSYLVTDHPSGINRLRYGAFTPADRRVLTEYLDRLQAVSVSELNRAEQKAYWINLYNALTIRIVLDHYPVKSIRDIDISPGWFSNGPWDAKLVIVEGEHISLNDIEHRILRPVWRDPRVHYAVNCASLGCPNLQPWAFTAENTEALLEKGARDYVNHPRGVHLEGNRLVLSSIYDWFREDFGGSEAGILQHLGRFADSTLEERLNDFQGKVAYRYDWNLNE